MNVPWAKPSALVGLIYFWMWIMQRCLSSVLIFLWSCLQVLGGVYAFCLGPLAHNSDGWALCKPGLYYTDAAGFSFHPECLPLSSSSSLYSEFINPFKHRPLPYVCLLIHSSWDHLLCFHTPYVYIYRSSDVSKHLTKLNWYHWLIFFSFIFKRPRMIWGKAPNPVQIYSPFAMRGVWFVVGTQ